MDARCRSCGSEDLQVFHELEGAPVHCSQLMPSRQAALSAPRGDLRVAYCSGCGFIQNLVFEASRIDYGADYEDSQAYSARFRCYAKALAEGLVARYGLRGKRVLEIGCGKGDFLALLCEIGDMRGIGIDPAYQPGRLESPALDRIEFITDLYSERYTNIGADLVCCRHTLEHLAEPTAFLELVRRGLELQRDPVLFFEVPDVYRVLDELAFWDLYYEHCSYFSSTSLARLFDAAGFEVLRLAKDFDDQYLLIEARAGDRRVNPSRHVADLVDLKAKVDRFAYEVPRRVRSWRDRLSRLTSRSRLVLWGAGSKAVGFLGKVGTWKGVDYVVDINPHKHGLFLAGTGQEIVPPEFLRAYRPDHVLVMNPIYREEIRGDLARLGLDARVWVV